MSSHFGLRWALQRRFLAYLGRLPDGSFSVEAGAARDDDGLFFFPAQGADPSLPLRFGGTLRLSGHLGMLHVKLCEPTLERSGDETFLTVADPGDDDPGARVSLVRVVLPEPVVTADTIAWHAAATFLTPEGSDVFDEQYPAGTSFEPLDIRLRAH